MTELRDIQRHLGVAPDGVLGPATLAAIGTALGIGKPRALADPAAFFAGVRTVTGQLEQPQVDTINALLATAADWSVAWLAYALGTSWHEARLVPVEEIGRGKGKRYGVAGARMKPVPGASSYGGQIPYGRGLVQLTWCDNYELADRELELGGALLKNFDLALSTDVAVRILVRGMEEGWFTGKALRDYLPGPLGAADQFAAARRIINGTDRADMIAAYALKFQAALTAGGWA
ncbi:hypothetical protein SAMN03159338_4284 [Sphingomonas sp. NFR04]|uniref:hypothetical protein n=1 Tax=Sphingomonas sp. NFR04 TaxID=1566283 RepID=UPI0008E5BCD8|nr:hypothetical protein [Sphingomonas sp. NFR04]SFK44811.1 hypothetical protein SAMN03159338_4284 [Sphingomonas sp. NFR04]